MKLGLQHAAILILSLTAIKLILPANSQEAQAPFDDILRGGQLYSLAMSVGRSLSGAEEPIYAQNVDDGIVTPSPSPKSKPDITSEFPLSEMVEQNLIGFSSPVVPTASLLTAVCDARSAYPAPDALVALLGASETPAPPEAPAENPKVAAFLQSQAAFSDQTVPDKVSYDTPVLPFEYTSPGDGRGSSGFGFRLHPIKNTVRFHYGTDIARNDGDDIYAFADGTVLSTQEISGYGLTVMLDHGDGYTTLYAHCSSTVVAAGDTVSRGQLVAKAGHSGNVTGPHLHFELMCNGIYYNPEFYL